MSPGMRAKMHAWGRVAHDCVRCARCGAFMFSQPGNSLLLDDLRSDERATWSCDPEDDARRAREAVPVVTPLALK
jgi:hypothetical protein